MRKCMTANELLAYNQGYNAGLKAGIDLNIEPMLRQQQAEIEKLRSWVEMLVEVPFFDEIDHYRGIPVSILKKAQEK